MILKSSTQVQHECNPTEDIFYDHLQAGLASKGTFLFIAGLLTKKPIFADFAPEENFKKTVFHLNVRPEPPALLLENLKVLKLA